MRGARDVNLPYFVTVMRGGNVVIAKSLGTAAAFRRWPGPRRGAGSGTVIDKKEATLDRAIHDRIVRPRKAGEADAAIDPLADPTVRPRWPATFEVLVGFQLSEAQLATTPRDEARGTRASRRPSHWPRRLFRRGARLQVSA
jgi:hypothetical protein